MPIYIEEVQLIFELIADEVEEADDKSLSKILRGIDFSQLHTRGGYISKSKRRQKGPS